MNPLFQPTTLKVVGLTFRDAYPDNLLRLSGLVDQAEQASIRSAATWADVGAADAGRLPVVLTRDGENPHDANAIEVWVPALGRTLGFVGFIPGPTAAKWAGILDGGGSYQANVQAVLIDPDHMEKPGLEIAVRLHHPMCPHTGDTDSPMCECDTLTPATQPRRGRARSL